MPSFDFSEESGPSPFGTQKDPGFYRVEFQVQSNRKELANQMVRVSRKAAFEARDTMRRLVPKDTKALKNSIRVNENAMGLYMPGGFSSGDAFGGGAGAGGGRRISEVLIGNAPGNRTSYKVSGPGGLSSTSPLYKGATEKSKEVNYVEYVLEGSPAIPVRYETAVNKKGESYKKAKALVWPNPKKESDGKYYKNWNSNGREFGIAYSRRERAPNRFWLDEGIRDAERYVDREIRRLNLKLDSN